MKPSYTVNCRVYLEREAIAQSFSVGRSVHSEEAVLKMMMVCIDSKFDIFPTIQWHPKSKNKSSDISIHPLSNGTKTASAYQTFISSKLQREKEKKTVSKDYTRFRRKFLIEVS